MRKCGNVEMWNQSSYILPLTSYLLLHTSYFLLPTSYFLLQKGEPGNRVIGYLSCIRVKEYTGKRDTSFQPPASSLQLPASSFNPTLPLAPKGEIQR